MPTEQQLFDSIVVTSIVSSIIFILFITAGAYLWLRRLYTRYANNEFKTANVYLVAFIYAILLLCAIHALFNAEVNAYIRVTNIIAK